MIFNLFMACVTMDTGTHLTEAKELEAVEILSNEVQLNGINRRRYYHVRQNFEFVAFDGRRTYDLGRN